MRPTKFDFVINLQTARTLGRSPPKLRPRRFRLCSASAQTRSGLVLSPENGARDELLRVMPTSVAGVCALQAIQEAQHA
jgi:hypothetical protein